MSGWPKLTAGEIDHILPAVQGGRSAVWRLIGYAALELAYKNSSDVLFVACQPKKEKRINGEVDSYSYGIAVNLCVVRPLRKREQRRSQISGIRKLGRDLPRPGALAS